MESVSNSQEVAQVRMSVFKLQSKQRRFSDSIKSFEFFFLNELKFILNDS